MARTASREAKRAFFAERDKACVDALLATHRDWIGRRSLSYEHLTGVRFDLGKLLRCGWHKSESEESHKFLRYLVRQIGESQAEIRIRDDVYWDELPKAGISIQGLRLPEPIGNRSPAMDRMLGEFMSARIDEPKPPRSSK